MQDMLISIITVCLNAVETIETTIRSVLQQTYKNVEYIVIDGGSTDGTLQIIEKYRNDISILISEKDEGIYDAMKKGIELARGDYIGIINADDWYEKDAVEHVVQICKAVSEDFGVISGQIRLIERGKAFSSREKDMRQIWTEMPIAHPATFIKKSVYSRYGKYDTCYEISADYEMVFRLFVNGIRFYISNKIMANYRVGGMSGIKKDTLFKEDIEILSKYQKYCAEPGRVQASIRRKEGIHLIYQADKNSFCEILDVWSGMNDAVYIFGCGFWGRELCGLLENHGIRIVGFIDNNRSLWGTKVEKYIVEPPNVLLNRCAKVIIAVQGDTTEIEAQVRSLCKDAKLVNLESVFDKTVRVMKG